jgi:hypothetical protein
VIQREGRTVSPGIIEVANRRQMSDLVSFQMPTITVMV